MSRPTGETPWGVRLERVTMRPPHTRLAICGDPMIRVRPVLFRTSESPGRGDPDADSCKVHRG